MHPAEAMTKFDSQGAATTAAVAMVAAATTYLVTKRVYENKIVTQRSEAYQKDRAEAQAVKFQREEMNLPVGKKLE